MKINDHFITRTPGGFLHLSEWGKGKYLHFTSTRLPDEDELRTLPVFLSLEAALDDMASKSDDWLNGMPVYVSHQVNQLLMIRVNRLLRERPALVNEHKTIRGKWQKWFPIRLP